MRCAKGGGVGGGGDESAIKARGTLVRLALYSSTFMSVYTVSPFQKYK